jgi:hypothetical protein
MRCAWQNDVAAIDGGVVFLCLFPPNGPRGLRLYDLTRSLFARLIIHTPFSFDAHLWRFDFMIFT